MESLWKLVYDRELMAISTDKLAVERPDQSARVILTRPQAVVLAAIFLSVWPVFFLTG